MKTKLLYLFTRTPLHVGAGSSVGAVDLPVQRERHTSHPIIPGSSIKGVIRYTAETLDKRDDCDQLFGTADENESVGAGDITFGEARPLAYPVRSAKGAFAYITCPLVLQRWAREASVDFGEINHPDEQTCFSGSKVTLSNNSCVLEEYCFDSKGLYPEAVESAIAAISTDPVWKEAKDRLVLLSDGDFAHFVRTTTEISHHNKIDIATGTVAKGALFNIESVPAETLFFAPIHTTGRYKDCDSEGALVEIIEKHKVLQFGGHSTTGLGFCSLNLK